MLFLLYLQFGALRAARDAVTEERMALARDQTRVQQLIKMKADAVGVQEQLNRLERMMPAEPDEDVLLADLQAAAEAAGLCLRQVRFEERVTGQGYVEMPFKLALEGRYSEVLDLLAGLRDGPRAVRIEELKLARLNEDSSEIRADIAASAFYAGQQ
ncbi:type 4a pilus biogenesis protein PilO [Desulforudis sp. 1088]|uniref:type 4a pilus biogenesis protein PilO n=1 Tax=unclassified Candidatus Desulforudis TaxID=2635950 RepID=UPI003CE54AD4